MRTFAATHTACYVCGSIEDVCILDLEPLGGGGYGPSHSPLIQIGLCKKCREKLIKTLQKADASGKKTWDEWQNIGKTMTIFQFMGTYLESKEEITIFTSIWQEGQKLIEKDDLRELADINELKVNDLKKALTSLKKKNIVYTIKDMPANYYGADIVFKKVSE